MYNEGEIKKLEEKLMECKGQEYMSLGLPSQLRGWRPWLDMALLGKPWRGALSAFIARPYWETSTNVIPGSNLALDIDYLVAAMRHAQDLCLAVSPSQERPVLVYTDASLEAGVARIGICLLVPGSRPRVVVNDVSPAPACESFVGIRIISLTRPNCVQRLF